MLVASPITVGEAQSGVVAADAEMHMPTVILFQEVIRYTAEVVAGAEA